MKKYANEIQKHRIPLPKPSMTTSLDEFRVNPRNYSGGGEAVDKAGSGGILERYREMLSQRDEEVLRAEDEVPPLSTDEVVRLYEALLVDLTISKPVITDLTIIAGEQREHGEGIADAICCRIVEAPVDRKLPSFYLLDSIVKNIGCEYVDYFSARLPEVFLEAYRQVDPTLNTALLRLFGTWSKVFSDSVLQKIDSQLQLMSESPRLSHGIHVNPKYVEARRHSESSILDNGRQRGRVASSPLRSYGQLTLPDNEYDLDSSEVLKAEKRPVKATGLAGRTSPNLGGDRWLTERETLLIEPDYKHARSTERDSGTSELWRKYSSDRTYPKLDSSSAYNEKIDPRALIDAYGSDRRKESKYNWQDTPKALIDAYGNDRGTDRQPHWLNNQLNVRHLEENTIGNKVTSTSWKNTEEVEYDWDDMGPSLAEGGRTNSFFNSHLQRQGGSLRTRYEPGVLGVTSDSELRSSNLSTSIPASVLNRGTTSNLPVHQDHRIHSSFQSSQSLLNSNGRGNIPISHPANNSVPSVGEDVPSLGYLPELNAPHYKPPIGALRGSLTSFDTGNGDGPSEGLAGAWPPGTMQKSQQPPQYSVLAWQNQFGQFYSLSGGDTVVNQVSNDPRFLPEQRFGSVLNNALSSQSQFPNQHPGYFLNKQPSQMQGSTLPQQYLSSQEGHRIFGPTATAPRPNHLGARPLHHGSIPQGNTSFASNAVPSATPGAYYPNVNPSGQPFIGGTSLSSSVPRPVPPPLLQTSGYPQNMVNHATGGGAFSGLISSLMSQGLISLTNQQDSVGVDFNPEVLKTRHDSAMKALYADLPRQCTTCGLRFKDQELHSNHMDWHVTKNRMNKNRKQKASRKWFASASMWLSGTEASGPEAVPGFLPTEPVVENQDDEEMAVPADEDQTTCELCGEPFDDFYSHETDEWMYRGAVYMNAAPGSSTGLDRSQLGAIVHAKCRPDPTSSSQSVATNNQFNDNDIDGSQRKRLRVS